MSLSFNKLQLVLCPRNIFTNISMRKGVISARHSREGGNPADFQLDSRLRGSDKLFVAYLWDTTLELEVEEMPSFTTIGIRRILSVSDYWFGIFIYFPRNFGLKRDISFF
jgi:hypothetical protein